MKIILFGATGMVGQGALRECLIDRGATSVLAIGRSSTRQRHEKLREIVHANLFDLSAISVDLEGYDACFFCLGVSSAGMKEEPYRRITHDLTLSVAGLLARLHPAMTFIYVSGADSSEKGRMMWARVKGATENAILGLPFKAYMFRPAVIVPLYGITSKTKLYQAFYTSLAPILPLLYRAAPRYVTTTEQLGRAMIKVARTGAPKRVLENVDINKA